MHTVGLGDLCQHNFGHNRCMQIHRMALIGVMDYICFHENTYSTTHCKSIKVALINLGYLSCNSGQQFAV